MEQNYQPIELNNGMKLPFFGQTLVIVNSTYKVTDKTEMVTFLRTALDIGYRHIDTAIMYQNESEIGEALQEIYKEGKYKRSDIILATKLFIYKSQKIEDVVRESLKNLQTDYIDIYYIHYSACPPSDTFEITHKPLHIAYHELEECIEKGLIKSIGVSNFNVQILLDLLSYCKVKPVINQCEVNIYFQNARLIEFCNKVNIKVLAYSPLARCVSIDSDDVLNEVAKKHNKSVPQIMLSFLLNIGVPVIPKTQNLGRLKENFESQKLKLGEEELTKLKGLNKKQRIVDPYEREFWKNIPYFD